MAIDKYTVTTAPVELPVTLEEAKAHCVIEHDLDDTLISSLISAATDSAERYTNRVFVERTFAGEFDFLSYSRFERFPYLEIRRAPLSSVIDFEVTKAESQVAFTDYEVKKCSAFSRVMITECPLVDNTTYPYLINFVAGYGSAAMVPEGIKVAIKELVCFMYVSRGVCTPDLPSGVKFLLTPYRIMNTF